MLKRLVGVVGLAVLVLLVVLVANTMRSSAGPAQALAAQPPVLPSPDEPAALGHLSAALRFRTVSFGDPERFDARAFTDFRDFLRVSYPRVFERLDWEEVNTHSLLGHWRGSSGGGEPAMFIAHYDVVPVDPADAGKWSADPFGGEQRDGFVWGRGALDDKVNVISILESIDLLLATGWEPRRDLWFGFGHDEEIGGTQGAQRIAALLEARGVKPGWMVDEGGAVSLPGMAPGVSRPVAMVGIAEKGYLSLELVARAEGGHSSVPRADSSILRLADALQALRGHPFPQDFSYLRWTAQGIAPELGFLPRVVASNLWLFGPLFAPFIERLPEIHAMTRTTIAPTMLSAGIKDNVQPTEAHAVINLRLLPGCSVEQARVRVAEVVGAGIELRVLHANEASPAPSSIHSTGWQTLVGSIRQVSQGGGAQAPGDPLTVAPFLVMGGTDLKHYEGIATDQYRFSFVPMSKEDFRRVHGIDERVPVAGYLDNIRFYTRLLHNAGNTP